MKTLFAQGSVKSSNAKYIFVDRSEDLAKEIIAKHLYLTVDFISHHYEVYAASSFKAAWEVYVADNGIDISYDNIIGSPNTKVITTINSKVTLPSGNDGMYCAYCEEFFPYAEPNQIDGSLICYQCRNL